MSTPDLNPLAQRLVSIAVRAGEMTEEEFTARNDWAPVSVLAEPMVVAVLRELAITANSFNPDLRLHAHQRRALGAIADSIDIGSKP